MGYRLIGRKVWFDDYGIVTAIALAELPLIVGKEQFACLSLELVVPNPATRRSRIVNSVSLVERNPFDISGRRHAHTRLRGDVRVVLEYRL